METTLITDFAILSIVMGFMVGLGTLSAIRGLFTFLVFIGLSLAQLLGMVGVNEIASYFFGQMIIMGSACFFLKTAYPETLVRVAQEIQHNSAKCH